MEKNKLALNRRELYIKYKFNHNIFVETGTHHGAAIVAALELGFKKILSVEIEEELYDSNVAQFQTEIHNGIVHLFHGDSKDRLPSMLELVTEPALFWLDAHYGSGLPMWNELNIIKNHPINTHTIMIDDIPIYFGAGDQVKGMLLNINYNYKFAMEGAINEEQPWISYDNYRLIAYI